MMYAAVVKLEWGLKLVILTQIIYALFNFMMFKTLKKYFHEVRSPILSAQGQLNVTSEDEEGEKLHFIYVVKRFTVFKDMNKNCVKSMFVC